MLYLHKDSSVVYSEQEKQILDVKQPVFAEDLLPIPEELIEEKKNTPNSVYVYNKDTRKIEIFVRPSLDIPVGARARMMLRQQKMSLLAKTDWAMLPDVQESYDATLINEIKEWRAAVRNILSTVSESQAGDFVTENGYLPSVFDFIPLSEEAQQFLDTPASLYSNK